MASKQQKPKKTQWTSEPLNRGKVVHWIDTKGKIRLGKYNGKA